MGEAGPGSLALSWRSGEAADASAVGWPMLLLDVALLVAIVAAYLPPEKR